MNFTETLGRVHPLHTLRKSALFRGITRRFDPVIRWRSPLLARPIYLRLISNASLIADPKHQEDSIRRTFLALLADLPSSNGGGFWDIGANIGLYSWSCAQARPDFRVVSFEPDAKNLECLRRTSAAWNLSRHEIVPCAVAETVGRTTFFTDEISRATGSLEAPTATFNAKHYGAVPRGVEVETVTIDHLIAQGWALPVIIKLTSKARSFESCEVVAASCASIAPFFFSKCLAIALKPSRSSRNTVMNVLIPIGKDS